MSAEVLRRAAALMRERAEAAIHDSDGASRWTVSGDGHHAAYGVSTTDGPLWDIANDVSGPDAEHIASWHPAVALAVADWLDSYAQRLEVLGHAIGSNHGQALTVASAYLGEDPP